MKTTLALVKKLNMDCKALLKDKMLDDAAEITNMILRANKKGLVEEDAWQYFCDCIEQKNESYFI